MEHILLLHGAIGSKDQLQPLASELKNKFTVHSLNFSGHGGAPMPDTFSIETFAEDVLKYLKENNIEKVNIFGYSMGGYVGLYLAKHHPEKINKVATLATKFLWTPEIAAKETKMLNIEKIIEKIPAFAETLAKRHAPGDWKMVLHKTSEMMITLGNKNTLQLSDYETIQHPIMVSIGDSDTMVTLEETKEVVGKLNNVNFIILPNTPHPIEKVDVKKLAEELFLYY